MKKLILIPILFLSYFMQAQYIVVKPSQLPAASTINLTDLFILNQGTTTKKVTYSILNTILKDTFLTKKVTLDSIAALREDIGTGGDCKLNINTSISNQLSNLYSTANIYSFCNTDAVTYAWSGPSIVGSSTTKNIIINEPGLYRVIASKVGCSSDTSEIYVNTIQWTTTPLGIKYSGGSGDSICVDNTGAIRNYVGGVKVYEMKSDGSIFPGSIKNYIVVDTFISKPTLGINKYGFHINENYGFMNFIEINRNSMNFITTNEETQNNISDNYAYQNVIGTNRSSGIANQIGNNYGTFSLIDNNYGTGLNFSGTGKHIRMTSTGTDTTEVFNQTSTGLNQVFQKNSVTKWKVDGDGLLYNTPPHYFSTFMDSTVLMDMTEDVPKQITNNAKTMWPDTEAVGFTSSGDTIINTYAGGYDFKFEYNAVGGGAADYRYYLKKKSGATTTTVYKYITSNAGGTVERTMNTHVHLLAGDKLWVEVENTTNSGDITVYAGIMRLTTVHLSL